MTAPTSQPRLLGEADAARHLGIGKSMLRGIGIKRRIMRGRRLYDRHDLEEFADRCPYEGDVERDDAEEWLDANG
jgi:hypothetical protein